MRASKTPDSRVAEDVEDRVRDLVDDGDIDAFQPAPDISESTAEGTETAAEKLAGDGGDTEDNADAETDEGVVTGGDADATAETSDDDGQGSLGDFA